MRRYDVVTGILLFISTLNFALAAPVSVQENQARVDVENMPKDLTNVLGKRWGEELERLGEEYFKTSGKSIDSSGTHSSSSTAPSGTDHGSTDVLHPPAPNLASSAATPDSLVESPCSSSCSSSSMQRLSPRGNCFTCLRLLEEFANGVLDGLHDRMIVHEPGYYPSSEDYASTVQGYGTSTEYFSPGHWQSSEPGTDYYSSDSDFGLPRTSPRPDPNSRPPIDSPEDQYFDFDRLSITGDSPPSSLKPASPKEHSEGSQSLVLEPHSSEGEEVIRPPSSPTRLEPQLYSVAPQPVDLLAAISAVKGKEKASNSISDTDPANDDASD